MESVFEKRWETMVGLEVHAELCTLNKLFCPCKNQFGAAPNTLCCPVCLGQPGAPKPVLNKQAVEYALRLGHALQCTIHLCSGFDRKHYQYPDLPKGYQITQFITPLCENGVLHFEAEGKACSVDIQRIQLEEDAGKLRYGQNGAMLVDYNRCGVPLVEVITAPSLHSAKQARACMEALATLMLFLGISDGKLQEGSLRADVNVSLKAKGQKTLGERCEMKNISGFAAVERAIYFEEKRQAQLLQRGIAIRRETRKWDDKKGVSTLMRGKEETPDYRYQPEPLLPPLRLDKAWVIEVKENLPELPMEKKQRYQNEWGLSPQSAQAILHSVPMALFFEEAASLGLCQAGNLANWMIGDLLRSLRATGQSLTETALIPKELAELVALVESRRISGSAGKQLLGLMVLQGGSPKKLATQKGLLLNTNPEELASLARQLILENQTLVADYHRGKKGILGYLVGQGIKQSRDRADPKRLHQLLKKELEG